MMPMPLPAGAPVLMTQEQEELSRDIQEWEQLQKWISIAKEREMYLRKSIAQRTLSHKLLPAGYFPAGTSRDSVAILGVMRSVKVGAKLNYKILPELIQPTCEKAGLTAEERESLIKTSYDLSMSGYKQLEEGRRTIINEMLLITPGAIDLEIK